MFRCSRRRGILWMPGMDGQQRRQAMVCRRTEEITDIIRKRRWSEVEARLVVSASQASGKTLSSFAREYGLQPSRIWRSTARLKGESKGGRRFHPVRLACGGPWQSGPLQRVDAVVTLHDFDEGGALALRPR